MTKKENKRTLKTRIVPENTSLSLSLQHHTKYTRTKTKKKYQNINKIQTKQRRKTICIKITNNSRKQV